MTINKEQRKNKILEAIITIHIDTALPVGSKQVSKLLDLSSATIRNFMYELEREGYIKQPYTSAGRIPTDHGYRRYVDSILSFHNISREDIVRKAAQYIAKKKFFEEVIEAISCAISRLTNYTGLALSPNNRLYFDGTYHMLEQPEFKHMGAACDFLRAMEEREEILHIMSSNLSVKRATIIRIGRENLFKELKECTIITSAYRFKNRVSGNIGLIGPMRMRYKEVVPIVEDIASLTSRLLEDISL
ncbi:MAG: hypothetical protein JW994_05285 [Candidatus Omnitrophica bacterium]|nr:hypothetical protein [Candidatus Omnitrophota bacterium]